MRNPNWLFLLTLGSGGVTLAAALAIFLTLQQRSQEPLQLPEQADAGTYGRMALDLAARDRHADALQANARALSYSPDQADLLYNQAWLEASLGRWQPALRLLDRAQARNPRDGASQYLRAWILQQSGQPHTDALVKALALKWRPGEPYTRGRLAQLENRHTVAIAAFDQALAQQPEQPAGYWYWRSRSLQALQRDAEALKALDRVIAARPDAGLYRERAALYERLGQPEPALADLASSQALEPSRETRLSRARLNLELYPQASLQETEALLKEYPGWLPAQLLQVRSRLNAKQIKSAQQALTALLVQHPESGEAWWLQGVIHRARRRDSEALSAQAKARSYGYDSALIELELARLAVQQGRRPEARLRVIRALQQRPRLKAAVQQDRLLKAILKSL